MVSDLISCYHTFKDDQPKLHNIITNANPKALVDLVKDNYILNKQAYDELEHYKRTTKILGKHPMFKIIKLKEGISALNTVALTKKITALNANLTRNRQKNNTELVTRDEQLLEHAKLILEKR